MARPLSMGDTVREHAHDKQWVSVALVIDTPEQPAVEFDREDGQVYVNVVLQPSLSPVRARIGSSVAGAGEGEYFPFLGGDEVLVVLPEGREDGGAIITHRLNNALDPFPMDSVAGQDPTTNSFAFRRRRTPYLEEFAGPVVMRNALTGAVFSLDAKGGVTIKDGENSALQISADALTLQGPSSPDRSPTMLFQMNFTEERGLLQVGDAQLLLNSSKSGADSYLTLPAGLAVSFGSNQPAEHVLTTEAFLAMFSSFLVQLSSAAGALPITAAHITAALAAWLLTLGEVPLATPIAAALALKLPLAASTPKPPVDPVTNVQIKPGLGAVNFRTG
jgi:hypothetical protein